MVKQCLFCGRYFTPDYRVKDKQKACPHPACRKARKKAGQKTGSSRNRVGKKQHKIGIDWLWITRNRVFTGIRNLA